jgi:hypothetical protein
MQCFARNGSVPFEAGLVRGELMAGGKRVRGKSGGKLGDELAALSEQVRRTRAALSEPPAEPRSKPEPAASPADEMSRLVDEWKDALEEGISDPRGFAADHPVVALSAAFLLGVVVGRLWRSS